MGRTLDNLHEELSTRQERLHQKSKYRFRTYLKNKAEENNLNYQISPNKSMLAKNVLIGDLNSAKYVICAHYDTPPRMPAFLMKSSLLLNLFIIIIGIVIILSFSVDYRLGIILLLVYYLYLLHLLGFISIANKYNYNDNTSGVISLLYMMEKYKSEKVCYLFFDNEEKGLIGSTIFRKKFRSKLRGKEFINLDCIGVGKYIAFSSVGKKNSLAGKFLEECKDIESDYSFIERKSSIFEMSDHFSFSGLNNVGIFTFNKGRNNKLKLINIHSHNDKILDLDNIEMITSVIINHIELKETGGTR